MKWLVGLLFLLNAGLFLWATGHNPGSPDLASDYPVVSEESMSLLSEYKARNGSTPDTAPRCVRIGPFVDSAILALATQKLDAMSLDYARRTVESREIRAYRVFVGPFESQSAVEAQQQLLEDTGIEGYYVKHDEEGGSIVSFGLFSQRDGAEALLGKLKRIGVRAKLRTEDRILKPTFWLEIDDPAVFPDVPSDLVQARWGEKGAQVRRYGCR
ncbi:MAG: hypothetical protein MAG794_01644 [Gammaproteobacteria bacterium]|nr:hypothetical protein [Gammaproteobacteria bacterium]